MAWNCELLTVLLGSPVKGHTYPNTAVPHTSSIKIKKNNLKKCNNFPRREGFIYIYAYTNCALEEGKGECAYGL